jgi:hypothetical protein
MSARKYAFTAIEAFTPSDQSHPEERQYPLPDAYHKILDYRVAEILLGTIALAAIAFLRFRFHH